MHRWLVALLGTAYLVAATPEQEFFESKVRPVLAGRCFGCHAETATAGLRLDSLEGLLQGGKSGPAISPGDPENSILLHALKGVRGRMAMPPAGRRLEAHQLESITKWIEMGAPWPMSPREFFRARVQPLIAEKCLGCHVAEPQGGLRMDSREAMLVGGKSGPALVAGSPDASLLVQAVRFRHEIRMPPTGPLSDEEVAVLERWVADGAVWDDAERADATPYVVSEEHRAHWAFQPLSNPPVPVVEGAANPIDRFLLASLAEEGLRPSPPADRRTLIRRATYDLTGLPPAPEAVEAFLAENSEDAFPALVDRMLDSPRYGERWGRHWLDLVRYADTAGDSGDFPVPEAYKYRNWVIDAFQDDMPYDQFVREQIAGDLLESETEQQRWDRLIATGYLAISRRIGVSPHRLRHITLEDTIDNLGKTFLGPQRAVRALPRPQVRSHSDRRLLPPLRDPRQFGVPVSRSRAPALSRQLRLPGRQGKGRPDPGGLRR